MHVEKLTMVAWKCFRAQQVLELRPVPHAIVARYEDDPKRSNWAGKTSLLQALDWALYGRLPEDAEGKDGVITRGERKTEVTLHLSDGSRVTRSKERGRPERLWYWPEGWRERGWGDKASMGAEAQSAIAEALGLDAGDFLNTSYFRQRQMARFILQDPAERLATVSGWLRLDPLERAEEVARDRLRAALDEVAEAEAKVRALVDAEAVALRSLDELGMSGVPEETLSGTEEELAEVRKAIEAAESSAAAAREAEDLRRRAEDYRRVAAEGKALRDELAKGWAPTDKEIAEAEAAVAEAEASVALARDEHQKRRRLLVSGFDGGCPVVGLPCPSSAFVRQQADQTRELELQAKSVLESAEVALFPARERRNALRDARVTRDSMEAKLAHLRETADLLRPSFLKARELRELEFARPDLAGLRARETALVSRIAAARHHMQAFKIARSGGYGLSCQLEDLRRRVETCREALLVFGKTGAQRRVAEAALDQIGADASGMLAGAGVPLTVGLRWSREGTGAASHCVDCGSPYPASRKVKECARCGAQRGPKLVHQLDVVMSDRSGAAEDLAAFALQVGASRWLRRERQAAWSTLLLDEPSGQLDEAMRRAFTAHLPSILTSASVTQALVVAHHASVLDSLPGRIEVVVGVDGSTARVVA